MKRISDSFIAVASVSVLILSLIMPVWVGMHNYATGDDLLYGSVVHNLMRDHASFGEIWHAAFEDVVREWYLFQGTWSSELLWRFEPSIWSEGAYHITIFISLISLIAGIFYFLDVALHRFLGIGRIECLCIACWVSFYSIQYMPYPRGGLYWFTGMTHYTLPYAMALFALGWAIMYLRTGAVRYLIGMIIIGIYMGGSGYPGVVVTGLGLFLCMMCAVLSGDNDKEMRHRGLMILIPIVLTGIGFIISAVAPGNAVRGGEDYGFSFGRVLEVFVGSFVSGLTDPFRYLISVRPLFLLLAGAFILCCGTYRENGTNRENGDADAGRPITPKQLIVLNVSLFLVVCLIHAPEIFAGDTVDSGFSGGVYDSYFYVTVLFLAVLAASLGLYLAPVIRDKSFYIPVRNVFFIGAVLFCVIFRKHLIGNMLDYSCYIYPTVIWPTMRHRCRRDSVYWMSPVKWSISRI